MKIELLNDERGASVAEYGLIIAIIAAGVIGVMSIFGGQLSGIFSRAGDRFSGV